MSSRPFTYSNWHRYLGVAVAILCGLGTLSIFRALQLEQQQHVGRMIHLAAEAVKADVIADMESRALAESRFAKMWEGDDLTRRNWDLNASLLMSHHPGSLAVLWLDRSARVIWSTYGAENSTNVVQIPNAQLITTLEQLTGDRRNPLLSPVFKSAEGEVLRWSVTPLRSERGENGYVAVLYNAEQSLAGMLKDVQGLGYGLTIDDHGTRVYALDPGGTGVQSRWFERTSVELPGDTFELTVWPTNETLSELETHLPQAALLIALTLSVLVIVAVRLATVARLRSRDLQVANDQLQLEVSERERTEEALRKSRARFAAILDMSADAIVCTNERGVITLFNESAERMFGQEAEEIIGSGIDTIVAGVGGDATGEPVNAYDAITRLHRTRQVMATRKGNAEFPADVTVSTLAFENEKIVTVILRDVTERHRMERELRAAHAELESRVAERTQQLVESVCQLQAEVNLRNEAEKSLRELSARILQLQDSERRRIARELHDSTAQILVAASMNIATIHGCVNADDAAVQGLVNDTAQLIEHAQTEIRTISYLLHPPLLEELGLASAVDWYATGFSKRSGVQITLDVSPDLGRLPQEYELTLFRIVQEALTNVHRHSRSRTAQISLGRRDDGICLKIADQGSGVPESKLRALETSGVSVGVGLAGMRERMRQLGGSMTITSGLTGTVVHAQMPFVSDVQALAGTYNGRGASKAPITQVAVA